MMNKPDCVLKLDRIEVDYEGRPRLCGEIYSDTLTTGNHPFKDGHRVITSPLVKFEGDIAITGSGTRYRIVFFTPEGVQ